MFLWPGSKHCPDVSNTWKVLVSISNNLLRCSHRNFFFLIFFWQLVYLMKANKRELGRPIWIFDINNLRDTIDDVLINKSPEEILIYNKSLVYSFLLLVDWVVYQCYICIKETWLLHSVNKHHLVTHTASKYLKSEITHLCTYPPSLLEEKTTIEILYNTVFILGILAILFYSILFFLFLI